MSQSPFRPVVVPIRPVESYSDPDLMQMLVNGNLDALGELYHRYSANVYGMARMLLGDGAPAEDVTQEVFLAVMQKAELYDASKGNLPGWLMRIARNRSLDQIRRSKRIMPARNNADDDFNWLETNLIDPEPDPADQAVDRDQAQRLRAALATMKNEDRQILELAYFRGMSQREMADYLKRPLGTVKSQVRAAMSRLAVLMSEDWTESPNMDRRSEIRP